MKRLNAVALGAALLVSFVANHAQAAESAAGGLEFSGHVNIVTGWQHDDADTIDLGSCSFGIGGLGCNDVDSIGSGYGLLGDFRGLATPSRDTFNFYVDQVELDVQKAFGENIRIRADLDFGRFLSGTPNQGGANFILEQGYVTFNIPIGNGAEFLVGRFNIPMGYESVDRINNIAISFSNIFRYVRPHNVTGAKFYYAFSELFDWNVYIVNNLSDTFSFASGTDSAIPSWGTRFGFTWGAEGSESTFGISYAGGPENFGFNDHLTHIFDLDLMFHISDAFVIGVEGIYRQDNTGFVSLGGVSFLGLPNSKALAGNIIFAYSPSETWDFFLRYEYFNDLETTGAYSGLDQQIHDFTVGMGYQITDDAKFKLEYRLDLRLANSTQFGGLIIPGDTTSLSNAVAGEFGYQF